MIGQYKTLGPFYRKPIFCPFIRSVRGKAQLFKRGEQEIVTEVLTETKSLIQNYLVGLSIEAVVEKLGI